MQQLILLQHDEQMRRLDSVRRQMDAIKADALLVTDNANTYYLTGRVFMGWIYIPMQGEPIYFIRRPNDLHGDGAVYVRKPEEMPQTIGPLNMPQTLALELDVCSYSAVERLKKVFPDASIVNGSIALRNARAVKTEAEIAKIRLSGVKQARIYDRITHYYKPGMTDLELQIEIERALRLEGCLGQFRISGDSMELFMGSVLTGDNADNPSPFDFAMGGAGIDESAPAGANNSVIHRGTTVMVDVNGNFTGYMTDMTRTYALGTISDLALKAHQCSIDICHALQAAGKPGVKASELYAMAEKMARDAGLHEYFMGHHQKAGFIGHGVGIEINELPVIAPRSEYPLQAGNVIALEPKFVIPKVGAVGIENTYYVTDHGMELLTIAPEPIQYFAE